MARGLRLVSLKTPDGRWRGLRDETTLIDPRQSFAGAGFSTLLNCYIDKTGTELRRLPGSLLSGRPFLGQSYEINSRTDVNASTERFELIPTRTEAIGAIRGDHFFLEDSVSAGARTVEAKAYITGNALTDGIYTASRNSATEVDLTTTGTGDNAGYLFVRRGLVVHQLYEVDGRPVIVAQTRVWRLGVNATDNFSCWVGGSDLDVANPLDPGVQGQVLDGQPNANDTGFVLFKTTTMENYTSYDQGESTNEDASYPNQYTINGRIQGDVLNGRLCLAVPGLLLMFQVDLRFAPPKFVYRPHSFADDLMPFFKPNHRLTRALGIPKGILAPTPGTSNLSGAAALTHGTYRAAVAYMDTITGEIGLASEIAEIVHNTNDNFGVRAFYPRAALHEAAGLRVIVLLSEVGDALTAVLFPWLYVTSINDTTVANSYPDQDWPEGVAFGSPYDWGAIGHNGPPSHSVVHRLLLRVNQQPDRSRPSQPRRHPFLENMPPGAEFCRVVRGRLFMGGARPDTLTVNARIQTTGSGASTDYFWGPNPDTIDDRVFRSQITSAYAGWRIVERLTGSGTDTERGQSAGSLIKKVNLQAANALAVGETWFKIDFRPFTAAADSDDFDLILRPDLVSYSEEANPGVVPSINKLELDRSFGRRFTAAARLADALFLFSDRHTEYVTWSSQPRQHTKTVLSHIYGCLGSSCVVETPVGVWFLSAEGPCIATPQVRYIGEPIREFWKTLVTTSEGLMPHAIAAIDMERQLVVCTVLRSLNTASGLFDGDDDEIARSPGDALIIWSWATGEFSVAHMDGDNRYCALNWMRHAVTSSSTDPRWRLAYVVAPDAQDNSAQDTMWFPVYSWDETANERGRAPVSYTATLDGDITFTATVDVDTDGHPPDFAKEDMAYIRGPGNVLRWWGKIDSDTVPADNSITLDGTDGAEWFVGDILEIRVIHMQMVTQRLQFGEPGFAGKVVGVTLRVELIPAKDSDGGDITQYAWARIRIEDETGALQTLTRNRWGDSLSDGSNRFRAGLVSAQECKIHIDLIGNGQIHVKDIVLEIEP